MAKFYVQTKEDLIGSPSRDAFKQWHKTLSERFYACDLDFVLVETHPPGVVAVLDYKIPGDNKITFAEILAYNDLLEKGIPVFIVHSEWEGEGAFENFTVQRYLKGFLRKRPKPPEVELEMIAENMSVSDFEKWEKELRHQHKLKDDKFRELEEHRAEIREWSKRSPNRFNR